MYMNGVTFVDQFLFMGRYTVSKIRSFVFFALSLPMAKCGSTKWWHDEKSWGGETLKPANYGLLENKLHLHGVSYMSTAK
jgi:hypothetical protein